MILIGMLHHRKDPQKVIKSYAYAVVAKAEGTMFVYFTPRAVNFTEKTIKGYIYENGCWLPIITPFPDVIYNAGSPIKLARSGEIVARLKETIPFTTHSIGNKMRVNDRLAEAGEFTNYLIPSEIIISTRRFFNFLNRYRKIVFKPVNGHRGQGIILVEQTRDCYYVLIGTKERTVVFEELLQYVSTRLREESYVAQPYINCKTKQGTAYDIRMHTQKEGSGKWVITAIYPRIAPDQSVVSNINSGGSTNYLIPFLKQEFGSDYYDVKRYLEHFALQLVGHLDSIQYEHFGETIDELGIDIGLDDLGKIWIFEVNWRPGCPPAFYLELNVVRHMIKYAIYLAQRGESNAV